MRTGKLLRLNNKALNKETLRNRELRHHKKKNRNALVMKRSRETKHKSFKMPFCFVHLFVSQWSMLHPSTMEMLWHPRNKLVSAVKTLKRAVNQSQNRSQILSSTSRCHLRGKNREKSFQIRSLKGWRFTQSEWYKCVKPIYSHCIQQCSQIFVLNQVCGVRWDIASTLDYSLQIKIENIER